jgi:hypothetical protein
VKNFVVIECRPPYKMRKRLSMVFWPANAWI